MTCGKCGGKVLVDRMFTKDGQIETYCIICGKRTFYDSKKSRPVGKWLMKIENDYRRINVV